jgi:general stress protein CsbA
VGTFINGVLFYIIIKASFEKLYLSQNLKISIDAVMTSPELKCAGSLYIVSDIIKKEHALKMLLSS